MELYDFKGKIEVSSEDDLMARLTIVRRGTYGAFVLCHGGDYPELSVHLNGEIAHLIYLRGENHPGYQPTGRTPVGCPEEVDFLLICGSLANSIYMPNYMLVDVDTAYQAAVEFFRSSELPPSVSWDEL